MARTVRYKVNTCNLSSEYKVKCYFQIEDIRNIIYTRRMRQSVTLELSYMSGTIGHAISRALFN
jgi:hypothetical protein